MVIPKPLTAGHILQDSKDGISEHAMPLWFVSSSTFCCSQLEMLFLLTHGLLYTLQRSFTLLQNFGAFPEESWELAFHLFFTLTTHYWQLRIEYQLCWRHYTEYQGYDKTYSGKGEAHMNSTMITMWWSLLWRSVCLNMAGKEEVKGMCLRESGVWKAMLWRYLGISQIEKREKDGALCRLGDQSVQKSGGTNQWGRFEKL